MNTVSVIVPTLDRLEHVRSVVESLRRQTVRPGQIIVVDQSHEDNALQLPDVVIYLHQKTCGPAAARNLGAHNSRGEILLFVEDDAEIPSKNFIENHIRWYQYSFIDVVHGAVKQVGKFLPPEPNWPAELNAAELLRRSPNCLRRQMCVGLAGGNFSIRREIFMRLGGFDETFDRGEDIELGIRLFRAGAVMIYDPEPLIVHLRSPGGTRSPKSPSYHHGVFHPEPHPGEYLLYLKHFPGWQARCWLVERLVKIWAPGSLKRPDRCLMRTIRLVRCIRASRRLLAMTPVSANLHGEKDQ